MDLAKLTIWFESRPNVFDRKIEVLYNPNQVTFTKAANWSTASSAGGDTAALQFTHGEPATLSLELFFDTYETGEDVQDKTRDVYHLTTVEQHTSLLRPPLCRLAWGRYSFGDSCWVITSLTQTFTLFKSDGTPVRATLSCSFRQTRSAELEKRLLDKPSPAVAETRVVQRGETLAKIAAEVYANSAMWRWIARANGIDNPRRLEPGIVLTIPVLVPESVPRRSKACR